MFIPKSGGLYRFYDPSARKYYNLDLPELQNSLICYAKNEWVLLWNFTTQNLYFFCPYTREYIDLPRLALTHRRVTFSDGPKSSSCILFTINQVNPSVVAVTYRPGDKEWTTVNYHNEISFTSCLSMKPIYCEGISYCFNIMGFLGVYDSQKSTWTVQSVPQPKCPEIYFIKRWWKRMFMAEHDGDIFIIFIDANHFIYKLDRVNNLWVEMKTLGGMTIFANYLSSHTKKDLLGTMRNNVYFSKVRHYGKRCFLYSLDDARFYPSKHCPDLGEEDPFGTVWIEPPEDNSVFL